MKHTCKTLIIFAIFLILSANLYADEIHDAVKSGDQAKVAALLADHPDWINQKNDDGLTPLNLACNEGQLEIFDFLLEKGADINIGDNDNSIPLHIAAQFGQMEMVQKLLQLGNDINVRDNNGMTALILASYGYPELSQYLVNQGADFKSANNRGITPLFAASIGGKADLVKFYIDKGAKIEPFVEGHIYPIHSAASYGRTEVARLLLENGAKADRETDDGNTPLSWAVNANSLGVDKLLIEHGADINHRDEHGATPLHYAAQRGNLNVVKYFVEQGADVNAVDNSGWTPLTMSSFADVEIAKYLIVNGAQVNTGNCQDKSSKCCEPNPTTPLHMAAQRGKIELAQVLLDNGARVNVLNGDGVTPLHFAILENDSAMVSLLLSRGAFVNIAEPTFGLDELHKAAIMGGLNISKAIIDAGANINSTDKSGHTALEYALYHGFKRLGYELLADGADDSKLAEMLAKPDLAAMQPEQSEAYIWYLGHSGWAIKTSNHLLIFDYYVHPGRAIPDGSSLASGYVNCDKLRNENVYVFCSHEHADHYSDSIFNWKQQLPNIKYVLGLHPRLPDADYIYAASRAVMDVDDIKVTTIPATDAGVAFLLEVDGLVIYHGGDHANEYVDFSGKYPGEIDYIAGIAPHIDMAFMGVTGCSLGDHESVQAGLFYALDKLKPSVTFPMHAGTRSDRYLEFADSVKARGLDYNITCAINRGDRFIYKDNEITNVDLDWTPSEAVEQKLSDR